MLVARLIAGAWRADVPPVSLYPEELDLILPLVLKSGTAALAWRRIRGTLLAATAAGRKLQEIRLVIAAHSAVRESLLHRFLSMDGLHKADPIVVKGWAHARLYPEPGLRPYGDFDLLVLPEHYESVESAYVSVASDDPLSGIPVDFHQEWGDLPDRTWDDIHAHSRLVSLGGSWVRVLGPEDSFRLSCLHLLRHAVQMPPRSNPLWLCDVSVMLERLPADFDWDYCLAGQRRHAQWMSAVIRLANQVLGARVDRCPSGRLPGAVPPWMATTFLRVWGLAETDANPWPLPRPLASVRRDIRELPLALAERWANPLQSICRLSWPINRVSGLVAPVVDYTVRALSWGPRRFSFGRVRAVVS
jgi:hypothetical protein